MRNHQLVGGINKQRVTELACREKIAKFIPFSSFEAPNGTSLPGSILNDLLISTMFRASSYCKNIAAMMNS